MKKTGVKTLIASLIAIVITFTTLIGTTFAWFTDSTTSTGNIIASGKLDVNAYWMEGDEDPTDETNWIKFDGSPIFNCDTWEPGRVESKHVKVTNEGTLAFKYKLNVVANGDVSALADVIDVYVLDGAQSSIRSSITDEDNLVGTLRELITKTEGATEGVILPVNTTPNDPATESVASVSATIAFKMRENVGNDYYGLSIGTDFDIIISAAQYEYEEDTFGSDYDKDAEFPNVDTAYVFTTSSAVKLTAGPVSVTIPAGSPEGAYRLESTNLVIEEVVNENSTKTNTVQTNIDLFHGNVDAIEQDYDVEIQLDPLLDVSKVLHGSNEISNYNYDKMTGLLTFTTTSFSPFTIEHTELAIGGKVKDGKIVAGTFIKGNPADLDPTLKDADSEYIAINYEKDGKTLYLVSERASTRILAPSAASEYKSENGNYTLYDNEASGKLYSIISGLQGNEHSTVCLLPGTYNEATTINVYSSMDIIGLGDKDSVKVIKAYSTGSNQHLFNCAGQKDDYIKVTLRNLYLDASEYNYKKATDTWGRDNAAVQSIRKSKVKCYDLTIVKDATNSAQVAFYVNGNNPVGGVKYTAYLYAENCTLNTTRELGVVTTSGTYKFYHNNLTYSGTLYTNNSGSIKNISMAADDWGWEN